EALPLLWSPPWRPRLLTLAAWSLMSAVLLQPAGLFVALYGSTALGFPPLEISAVVWVSGVAGVASYALGGWLSDRIGGRLEGSPDCSWRPPWSRGWGSARRWP